MKFLSKKIILMSVLIVTFICCTALSVSAAVNVSGGLQQIVTPLKTQIKNVAAIVFALLALVALTVAIVKLISGFIENHRTNEPINYKPVALAFVAAVVAGLCSSTAFFGWFGI